MADLDPSLKYVVHKGTLLVSIITRYLSTLPLPIEVIEELVAVCSVTCSLLLTLEATIGRFQSTTLLCPKASFINPLCHDILAAFNQLGHKVSEARRFKVFEPNDVGLVRAPRNGWIFIMGSEAKAAQLRSRLYVEKYRVRVLIDVVAWYGLGALGRLGRTPELDREMDGLRKMLPLLADRSMGVWRDYQPRIASGSAFAEEQSSQKQQQLPTEPKAEPVVEFREAEVNTEKDAKDFKKLGIHSSPSTTSLSSSCSTTSTSSSITIIDDSIKERWILRRSEAKKILSSQGYCLGIPIRKTYTHTPSHHHIQALSSHESEISALITQQTYSKTSIHRAILSLPDDAQREIQKLIEARQKACSNDNICRSFEVIAFQPRLRRKIAVSEPTGIWGCKKAAPLEWVIGLRGETVDRLSRKTPVKNEDAWSLAPSVSGAGKTSLGIVSQGNVGQQRSQQQYIQHQQQQMMIQQQQVQQQSSTPAPGAQILKHIDQKRGMSHAEAEATLASILKDLFQFKSVNVEKADSEGMVAVATVSGEDELSEQAQGN